jgi:hypothetical protein
MVAVILRASHVDGNDNTPCRHFRRVCRFEGVLRCDLFVHSGTSQTELSGEEDRPFHEALRSAGPIKEGPWLAQRRSLQSMSVAHQQLALWRSWVEGN